MPECMILLAAEDDRVGLYLLGKADCPPSLLLLRRLLPDVERFCSIIDFNTNWNRTEKATADAAIFIQRELMGLVKELNNGTGEEE